MDSNTIYNKYVIKTNPSIWYMLFKRELQEKNNIFFPIDIKIGEDDYARGK